MEVLRKLLLGSALMFVGWCTVQAQCETWEGKPDQTKIVEAHVLYRGLAKGKDAAAIAALDEENFNILYNNWKKAYAAAPAADGKRSYHFTDGVNIIKALKQRGASDEEKAQLDEQILELWTNLAECFPDKSGIAYGRRAFDMFYMPAYGYRTTTLEGFKEALDKGGNDLEYIVFEPLGQLVNYLFQNDQLSGEEAQKIVLQAYEIADYNIANNKRYAQYYESSKARMEAALKESESGIFDCDYFKEQLLPIYQENKDSLDILKYVYLKLVNQGCDTTDVQVAEVKETYEALAAKINAEREAEFLANNPAVAANKLYRDEKFEEAIEKFREAIEKTDDDEKKGEYYFSIASIQFRKLNMLSPARASALKAAELKPNWGRPYLLIGDMYAGSAKRCGKDAFEQGVVVLAAIDKYAYARAIDEDLEVQKEAVRKIAIYNKSIPLQGDAFLRQKIDATVNTGCWIGERVKVRTRKD